MKHTNQETTTDGQAAQYLTFMLGGEAFGIGIMAVKEIIEFAGITEVPMMPDSIRGVINLRGAVVPVMDLAARFGRPRSVPGKRTCIVIVELESDGARQLTGVVVDAVSAVLDIPASEIEPAPSFGTRIHGDFIAGMGKVNGRFVILLNVDSVLAQGGLTDLATDAAALLS
ncbi:chemotaxis protein CheW [Massilia putida]|uniref:chemotaxis protein CheW n=1 Tax=Massilia putida TaxID=1141883 RepID=UPI0009524BBC|nr:chemotaxis protein CheW [Massilia putida]